MLVTNPRFPHWCRILRKAETAPLDDEEVFSPLEDEESVSPLSADDPLADDSEEVTEEPSTNEQDGEETEDAQTEEDSTTGDTSTVIYEGECRSYEKNSTSDKGDIITSYRGLALPLMQDDWDELGVVPQEGDEVIVVHGTFQEYGRVIDKNVATASYAGTHIIWRYGRN